MATTSDVEGVEVQTNTNVLLKNGSETSSECWMPRPQSVPPDCPAGLEFLTAVDQVIIHQAVEVIEAVSRFETTNKYRIRNSQGQTMYTALEESTCMMRQCCGKSRPFELSISSNTDTEVIRLLRPYRCECTLCCCCRQQMEVQSPPGVTIGWIRQNLSFLSPDFSVTDESGEVMYRVKGPCLTCKWCDVEFHVTSAVGGEDIGTITKQWSGLSKEYFTDADNFGMRFPIDMDVKMKAVMLGAVFLIDFMYFES